MLVFCDESKFKADPEYYNMRYLKYIYNSWEKYRQQQVKRIMKLKSPSKLQTARNELGKAEDNMMKLCSCMACL